MTKCTIIYNPNSGRKEVEKYIPEIEKIIQSKYDEVEFISTKYKGHAIKIIEKLSPVDLVMSFGGDGTFNEVVTGNLKRKTPLLLTHIPVGTTNDIGAMLGYTKDILSNISLSLNGKVKDFDIGLINKHPFVYVAGFGKYTNISYDTPRPLKKKIGHLAYLKGAFQTFFQKTKLYDVSYEVNGEKYRGLFSFIIISNANHIAGVKNVYKDVLLDDDKLEVVLCTISKKKDILKSLYFLTTYDPSKVPGIYFYKTNEIKLAINNAENKTWCIDGEKLEKNKQDTYHIKIQKNLKILVTKKNISKLFQNKD